MILISNVNQIFYSSKNNPKIENVCGKTFNENRNSARNSIAIAIDILKVNLEQFVVLLFS